MPARVKEVVARKDYPNFGITRGQKHWSWTLFRGVTAEDVESIITDIEALLAELEDLRAPDKDLLEQEGESDEDAEYLRSTLLQESIP